MALHTTVFIGSTSATWTSLLAVPDGVFGTLSPGLIPNDSMRLVAAVAGGTGLQGARLEQRSMSITPANIHPLNPLPWPSPVGVMSFPEYAPCLPGGEAVVASAFGSSNVAVVGWFADRVEPVPAGESFLLAFSASVSLTSKEWGRTELAWDVPYLPAGRYHVVGLEVHTKAPVMSTTVRAARLVLPNQVLRPGALVFTATPPNTAEMSQTPPFQMDGSLGTWGWFEQGSPPQLEVVGTGDETLSLRGHVRVIKENAGTVVSVRMGGARWGVMVDRQGCLSHATHSTLSILLADSSRSGDLPFAFLMDECLKLCGWFERKNPHLIELLGITGGIAGVSRHIRIVKGKVAAGATLGPKWG